MSFTVSHVDTHRMDLRFHGRLLAYGIRDMWGWSLLQLFNGRFVQVDRVEDAPSLSTRSTLDDRAVRQLVAVGNRTYPGLTS